MPTRQSLQCPMLPRFVRRTLAFAALAFALQPEALAFSNLPTTVPPEPALTVNKDTGTGEVVLTWTATTGPYVVSRNTSPNFSGVPAAQILASSVSGTEYRDAVLNDGITYYYSVEDANVAPRIYSATANSSTPGTAITLTGVGFDPVGPANNEVRVGGTPAAIISVSNTALTYTTPPALTGYVVVRDQYGVAVGQIHYVVATGGLNRVSSVAVDGAHVPFVADTGGGIGTWDRVFKFDPATGVRTEVGNLDEPTGLPTDNSNRVYYGNAFLSTTNFGTINRTSSSGGQTLYRACGNSGTGANCYVFGIGLDPSLTDFGADGRVYIVDACTFNTATMSCRTSNQEVRIVPPAGVIQTFANGFTFGNSPRGIVVDRNSTSAFFRDVFVSDSTSVRRFSSSTVPGVLQKTYNSANASIFSPRQMAITPFAPKERLLVADDGIGKVVAIDPLTDKFKVIDIPLTNPKTIALDQDASGTTFAYVGEPTRVLKFPVHARTLYLAIWIGMRPVSRGKSNGVTTWRA